MTSNALIALADGESDDPNFEKIQESLERVTLAHKTYEKAREIEASRVTTVKWLNIILTTVSCTSIVGTLIGSERVLLYVATLLSACTLVFVACQLTFDPAKEAERHRAAAKELWYIREHYKNLLADLRTNPNCVDIPRRRDELMRDLKRVYETAPDTSSKAYRKAQDAIRLKSHRLSASARRVMSSLRHRLSVPAVNR